MTTRSSSGMPLPSPAAARKMITACCLWGSCATAGDALSRSGAAWATGRHRDSSSGKLDCFTSMQPVHNRFCLRLIEFIFQDDHRIDRRLDDRRGDSPIVDEDAELFSQVFRCRCESRCHTLRWGPPLRFLQIAHRGDQGRQFVLKAGSRWSDRATTAPGLSVALTGRRTT